MPGPTPPPPPPKPPAGPSSPKPPPGPKTELPHADYVALCVEVTSARRQLLGEVA